MTSSPAIGLQCCHEVLMTEVSQFLLAKSRHCIRISVSEGDREVAQAAPKLSQLGGSSSEFKESLCA